MKGHYDSGTKRKTGVDKNPRQPKPTKGKTARPRGKANA